jgi:hypothetical protein
VQGIERTPGRTDVLVDEGINVVTYTLDEALIDFQSAIEELVSARVSPKSGAGGMVSCRKKRLGEQDHHGLGELSLSLCSCFSMSFM